MPTPTRLSCAGSSVLRPDSRPCRRAKRWAKDFRKGTLFSFCRWGSNIKTQFETRSRRKFKTLHRNYTCLPVRVCFRVGVSVSLPQKTKFNLFPPPPPPPNTPEPRHGGHGTALRHWCQPRRAGGAELGLPRVVCARGNRAFPLSSPGGTRPRVGRRHGLGMFTASL